MTHPEISFTCFGLVINYYFKAANKRVCNNLFWRFTSRYCHI